jgi:uncharacterized membrane protein YbhN (UPF0104 family)
LASARVKFLLRAIVSIALIGLVLRKVNWGGLGAILSHVDLRWALLGSALTLLLITSLAFRWRIFLRLQEIRLPFLTILSVTWMGQFFNSFLPGSTGGDVIKIYQVCRLRPDRKAAVAATVIADRLSALVALLLLAAVSFVIEPLPLRLLRELHVPTMLIVILGVIAGVVGLVAFRMIKRTQLGGKFLRLWLACRETLALNLSLVLAVAFSLAIHLLNFFVIYLFARSLHLTASVGQILLMMPVVLFLVLLPITINGHGLRELLLIGYFTQMGITTAGRSAAPQEVAVALSLLVVTNDLLWSLPGGLRYFAGIKADESKARPQGQIPTA